MPYLTTKDVIGYDSAMFFDRHTRSLHAPTGAVACIVCGGKSKKPKLI